MLYRLFVVLALALAVAGCDAPAPQVQGEPAPSPRPAEDGVEEPEEAGLGEGFTVVATVYTLSALAEDIAPGADVQALTGGGQDPHDLELSPRDRQLMETADVVLYMGDIDFQPQVEAAVTDATGQVVAVAEIAGDDHLLDFDDDDGRDDDDVHGHDDDDGAGEADAHAGTADAVDPHIWFDAEVVAEVAEEIGEAFAVADSDRADDYRSAASALHEELLALDAEIDTLLSGCAYDTAIVSHEAYAYLLGPRGLEQEGISGAGGHGGASPQRIAELAERIRAEGIPAVLAEPVEGRADAEALANEAGVELLDIDPLEIAHEGLAAMRFPDALRDQAEAFATALACG